ncbi:MAG: hypothetical protein U1G07_24575 [Verrucomicrobiota bacterium]
MVGPNEPVGIRKDARWNVPEPELALVLNSAGTIVGYTIGNDAGSAISKGENVLYLPQAKIYSRSCALGPFITLGISGQKSGPGKSPSASTASSKPSLAARLASDKSNARFPSWLDTSSAAKSSPKASSC